MTVQIVILQSAETDLRDLKNYLVKNFGHAAWRTTYAQIKETIAHIAAYPNPGGIPDELSPLHLVQYRQTISGMNRILRIS